MAKVGWSKLAGLSRFLFLARGNRIYIFLRNPLQPDQRLV